jgi:hypothetical protein
MDAAVERLGPRVNGAAGALAAWAALAQASPENGFLASALG